jgi:hypothetical protein
MIVPKPQFAWKIELDKRHIVRCNLGKNIVTKIRVWLAKPNP